jgi:hypothetical protein
MAARVQISFTAAIYKRVDITLHQPIFLFSPFNQLARHTADFIPNRVSHLGRTTVEHLFESDFYEHAFLTHPNNPTNCSSTFSKHFDACTQ